MGLTRRLGSHLAGVPFDPQLPAQDRLGSRSTGRDICSVQRGGSKVAYGRKGKGSTWHAITDAQGLPIAGILTDARAAEVKLAIPVVDLIKIASERGAPRRRPKRLVADRGYDSRKLRNDLRERNIQPVIPARKWKNRKPRPGRPVGSGNMDAYKGRWKIERTFSWMDNFRRLAVRFERKHLIYEAFLELTCALMCLNRILR